MPINFDYPTYKQDKYKHIVVLDRNVNSKKKLFELLKQRNVIEASLPESWDALIDELADFDVKSKQALIIIHPIVPFWEQPDLLQKYIEVLLIVDERYKQDEGDTRENFVVIFPKEFADDFNRIIGKLQRCTQ